MEFSEIVDYIILLGVFIDYCSLRLRLHKIKADNNDVVAAIVYGLSMNAMLLVMVLRKM